MRKICMSLALSLCLGAVALAQSPSPSDPQSGSQGTVPSTSPSTSPSQSPDMNSGGQSQTGMQQNGQSNNSMKGEKKMKGCIESQGGSYVLMDKHGKQIPLTGSDLASHVGHTVTVHGTYGSGASSATSTSSNSDSGQAFTVSKVDMDSETCKMDKNKKSGNMSDTTQSPK